jgi:dihydroorotate dehydrogenase electron transfer subunit
MALARTMEKLGRSGELTLLYGDGRQGLLIDPGSDMFPKVRTLTCTEDGSCGTRGMVTGLLEEVNLGEGAHLYVCGPNPMMRAVMAAAGSRCLSAHYSLEARMACGFGVCSGCAVKMASGEFVRACREGPVFDGEDLSLESFGGV